jgi:hypothetical protein
VWVEVASQIQFDDPVTVAFNDRIDAIILFEDHLRRFKDNSVDKIIQADQLLKTGNAWQTPFRTLHWDVSAISNIKTSSATAPQISL